MDTREKYPAAARRGISCGRVILKLQQAITIHSSLSTTDIHELYIVIHIDHHHYRSHSLMWFELAGGHVLVLVVARISFQLRHYSISSITMKLWCCFSVLYLWNLCSELVNCMKCTRRCKARLRTIFTDRLEQANFTSYIFSSMFAGQTENGKRCWVFKQYVSVYCIHTQLPRQCARQSVCIIWHKIYHDIQWANLYIMRWATLRHMTEVKDKYHKPLWWNLRARRPQLVRNSHYCACIIAQMPQCSLLQCRIALQTFYSLFSNHSLWSGRPLCCRLKTLVLATVDIFSSLNSVTH